MNQISVRPLFNSLTLLTVVCNLYVYGHLILPVVAFCAVTDQRAEPARYDVVRAALSAPCRHPCWWTAKGESFFCPIFWPPVFCWNPRFRDLPQSVWRARFCMASGTKGRWDIFLLTGIHDRYLKKTYNSWWVIILWNVLRYKSGKN